MATNTMRPLYLEEVMGFTVEEYSEFQPGDDSYLIVGFPDAGLVGPITVSYIVRKYGMSELAGIDNRRLFPPVSVIVDGRPRPPVRVFGKDNIYAVVSEVPLPAQAFFQLADFLVEWARLRGFRHLVSVTGLGVPNRLEITKPKLYWLATSREAEELGSKLGGERFRNGIIAGPYSLLLKNSLRRRVSNLVVLAEAFMDFPDPEAASAVVEGLNRMLGLGVDLRELLESAESIKLRMKELMKSTKPVMAQMGKNLEYQGPMIYS
ncbi:MAG: proteasome assembly chaperone family protein [Desulfurococcales archaeon]|nr:proteasome assembly chaperone family protein [Desulfurococcales archaeon]